jgi:hypothetical protein
VFNDKFEKKYKELKQQVGRQYLEESSNSLVEELKNEAASLEMDFSNKFVIHEKCNCSGVDFSGINFYAIRRSMKG